MKKYKRNELELMSLEEMNTILSEYNWGEILELNEDNILNTMKTMENVALTFLAHHNDIYPDPQYFHYWDSPKNLMLFINELEAKMFALKVVEGLLKSDNRLED